MTDIIGEPGKSKYNRDLASKVNKLAEAEAKRKPEAPKVGIEDICKAYEKCTNDSTILFGNLKEITDKLDATKEQILEFSKILINYKNLKDFGRNAPRFISSLMNSSITNYFPIDMKKLNQEGISLSYVCTFLENNNVHVIRDVKHNIGHSAENCDIVVDGNAGNYVGENAKRCLITVNGNAGHYVGLAAENCTIKIQGSIGSLADTIGEGTKIYQGKDKKLIYPK